MKIRALLLTLLACALAPSLTAQYPTLARGFEADRLYQFNDQDAVSPFNGNLVVTVPIGQTFKGNGNLSYRISAVYNSRNWDFERRMYSGTDPMHYNKYFNKAIPSRRSNAGMGWLVTLGRIIAPNDPVNDYSLEGGTPWTYESPDGSDHLFSSTLHNGETAHASYMYTRDGSMLRLRTLDASNVELHFPDGSVHKFQKGGSRYWLVQISDVYGNNLIVTYVDAAGTEVTATNRETAAAWKLVERTYLNAIVRTHWIRFAARGPQNAPANYNRQVSEVELAAFNGTTAKYGFNYVDTVIGYTCLGELRDTWTPNPMVPLLSSVTLPDGLGGAAGSSHAFTYRNASPWPVLRSSRLTW